MPSDIVRKVTEMSESELTGMDILFNRNIFSLAAYLLLALVKRSLTGWNLLVNPIKMRLIECVTVYYLDLIRILEPVHTFSVLH